MGKRAQKQNRPVKVDERGQILITLDGTDFMLRPSFEAILEFEEETGLSLFDLASLAANSRMRLDQQGVVVSALMKAHGKANPDDPLITTYMNAKPETLAKLIMEAGTAHIQSALTVILSAALMGGYDASGEVKAPTN